MFTCNATEWGREGDCAGVGSCNNATSTCSCFIFTDRNYACARSHFHTYGSAAYAYGGVRLARSSSRNAHRKSDSSPSVWLARRLGGFPLIFPIFFAFQRRFFYCSVGHFEVKKAEGRVGARGNSL